MNNARFGQATGELAIRYPFELHPTFAQDVSLAHACIRGLVTGSEQSMHRSSHHPFHHERLQKLSLFFAGAFAGPRSR